MSSCSSRTCERCFATMEVSRTRALCTIGSLLPVPRKLAESQTGFAVVELVLSLLVAEKDARALAVQQTLLDAKVTLWGECPAVWLERHNLGTVYAQLGQFDEARTLIEDAME